MVVNDTRTERIQIKILEKLDKLKYVNRKDGYSKRIALFMKYCKKDREKFNAWLKQEVKDAKQ